MPLVYSIAEKADEPQLRQLMRNCTMKGAVELAFLQEPDFIKAQQVHGRFVETYVAHESENNTIVGMGTRAVKPAYINGKLDNIGYLCNLRLLSEYQKGTALARGYKMFRHGHNDSRTNLYLSTIIEDNIKARTILESGRAALPVYTDIGRFRSFVFSLRQKVKQARNKSIAIKRASKDNVDEIVKFLNTEGANKQFFPQYFHADLTGNNGILPNLNLRDIYLAYSNSKLIGITAAWDQTQFRQNLIVGYDRTIKHIRPIINFGLGIAGYPTFPKPGTILKCFTLGLICIKNNEPKIFSILIDSIISDRKNTYSLMIAGLHENDSLLKVLTKQKGIAYNSRLYAVCWDKDKKMLDKLDNKIPYLELGAL